MALVTRVLSLVMLLSSCSSFSYYGTCLFFQCSYSPTEQLLLRVVTRVRFSQNAIGSLTSILSMTYTKVSLLEEEVPAVAGDLAL